MDWLLDADPAVRRQVMRDLADVDPAPVAAERARVALRGARRRDPPRMRGKFVSPSREETGNRYAAPARSSIENMTKEQLETEVVGMLERLKTRGY
jgi:hypothetical protein